MIRGGCTHSSSFMHRWYHYSWLQTQPPLEQLVSFQRWPRKVLSAAGPLSASHSQVNWSQIVPIPDISKPNCFLLCIPWCIPSAESGHSLAAHIKGLCTRRCRQEKCLVINKSLPQLSWDTPAMREILAKAPLKNPCVSLPSPSLSPQISTLELYRTKSSHSWQRKAAIFLLTCLNITSAAHLKHSSTSVPTSVSVLQSL